MAKIFPEIISRCQWVKKCLCFGGDSSLVLYQ